MSAEITKNIAYAAGADAGNRSASRGGRNTWNEEDWNAAATVTEKLIRQIMGKENE